MFCLSKLPPWAGRVALAGLLLPPPAAAHSFGQVYTLPVPFWLYAWAAAAVLIVSFVVAGIFLGGAARIAADRRPARVPFTVPTALVRALQVLSVLGLLLCLATGFFGTRQPYANFNMTFFWIVFVLGFAYLTALCGDWYALINPWRVLCAGLSRLWPAYGRGRIVWPERLGYWPAVALYAGFIWLELFGKSTPFSLSAWLTAYTALNLSAVGLVGARSWFQYGEIFSVLLRLLARMSPLDVTTGADGRATARWRAPFSGLLGREPDHPTLLLFVLFLLSATAFDGLHTARPWVQLFWTTLYRDLLSNWLGNNAFAAFPMLWKIWPWWQTAWLLLSPLIYLAVYLGTVDLVHRITGRRHGRAVLAQRFLHSLLPIVLVYHVTHYYTLIQTQGVKIVALVSDPFGFGWNLFGTAAWLRGTIVPDTTVVWHVQVALLLAGHVVSVVLAHLEALRVLGDRRTATLSQLPMLALMVAFTVFGLWILSLPLDAGGYG